MIDINELRRLAQAATPGPWMLRTAPTSAGLCHIISAAYWRGAFIYGDGLRIGVDDSLPKAQELAANAHLIAAANPAAITELLDRLEAAEKSDAESIAMYRKARDERDALRAKIAEMEKQEPAAWCDTAPLYALPGAQPAPSVPDGWRLVPIEPTPEMIDKGSDQSFGYMSIALYVWAAMLAATPEAKP